jgi:hypothetical protein
MPRTKRWVSVPQSALFKQSLTVSQFQKIFAINLPSRVDHRDSLSLAAAYTGLRIDYVDGVTEMDDKALPPHPDNWYKMPKGAVFNWRAHMNVLRQ